MIPTGSELKLCCVNCEEAIDEIGQLTWVLRHESVSTVRELSQPRGGNRVYEFQRIRRRDHDVFTAGGDQHWRVYPSQPVASTAAVPRVRSEERRVGKEGRCRW